MAAIEIQGLEKSYKTGFFGNKLKQGLKPLTLTVEEGEVFGCLGPNGAGKTTTLKLLLGLVFPAEARPAFWGGRWTISASSASSAFSPSNPISTTT